MKNHETKQAEQPDSKE